MGGPAFCLAAVIYSLLGITVALWYSRYKRVRESSLTQLATVINIFLTGALVLQFSEYDPHLHSPHRATAEAYLFFAASVCHLPVLVFIVLFQWNRLLEHLTSPGRRDETKPVSRSLQQEWAEIKQHLEVLSRNPLNVYHRRHLGEIYLRLGLTDSAASELRKAADCLERSYEQAYLLYKVAWIFAHQKRDVPSALPFLRRIIRIYPKSYFAAYARRIVNRYEAHHPVRDPG